MAKSQRRVVMDKLSSSERVVIIKGQSIQGWQVEHVLPLYNFDALWGCSFIAECIHLDLVHPHAKL